MVNLSGDQPGVALEVQLTCQVLLDDPVHDGNTLSGHFFKSVQSCLGEILSCAMNVELIVSDVPPILSPQCFKRFTSSSEIVSCWPYMARKMAKPIATSEAAMAIAKIA